MCPGHVKGMTPGVYFPHLWGKWSLDVWGKWPQEHMCPGCVRGMTSEVNMPWMCDGNDPRSTYTLDIWWEWPLDVWGERPRSVCALAKWGEWPQEHIALNMWGEWPQEHIALNMWGEWPLKHFVLDVWGNDTRRKCALDMWRTHVVKDKEIPLFGEPESLACPFQERFLRRILIDLVSHLIPSHLNNLICKTRNLAYASSEVLHSSVIQSIIYVHQ